MRHPAGVGILFANKAKSGFLALTGSRYDSMVTRMAKKKLPPLPFTKAEFRAHVLAALGGFDDGAIQCRYCRGFFTLTDLAGDHAKPLSRGGSAGLDNLEYPCKACNDRKGSMTPDEFLALLEFLDTRIPLARIDVLKRLGQSVKLAAGARRAVMLAKGKQAPLKQQQPAGDGMPPF
jgi:hypothetical protein